MASAGKYTDYCDGVVQRLFGASEPLPRLPQEMWEMVMSHDAGLASLNDFDFGNRVRTIIASSVDCPITAAVKREAAARVKRMTPQNYARALRKYLSGGIYEERSSRSARVRHHYSIKAKAHGGIGVAVEKWYNQIGGVDKLRMTVKRGGARAEFVWNIRTHDGQLSLRLFYAEVTDLFSYDAVTFGSGGADFPAEVNQQLESITSDEDKETEMQRVQEIAESLRIDCNEGELLMDYVIRIVTDRISSIAVAHINTEAASSLKNTKELLDGTLAF